MEEIIKIIEIINILKNKENLSICKNIAKDIVDFRKEYPKINWKFLDEIEKYNYYEIDEWLSDFIDNVYIYKYSLKID